MLPRSCLLQQCCNSVAPYISLPHTCQQPTDTCVITLIHIYLQPLLPSTRLLLHGPAPIGMCRKNRSVHWPRCGTRRDPGADSRLAWNNHVADLEGQHAAGIIRSKRPGDGAAAPVRRTGSAPIARPRGTQVAVAKEEQARCGDAVIALHRQQTGCLTMVSGPQVAALAR
jgi:hypothetical protein